MQYELLQNHIVSFLLIVNIYQVNLNKLRIFYGS